MNLSHGLAAACGILAASLLIGCSSTRLSPEFQGRLARSTEPVEKVPLRPVFPTPATPTEEWTDGANSKIKVDGDLTEERRWTPVYFAYDQSNIGETERQKLNTLYDFLKDNRQFDILVEGHCDERGSEEYNRTLGERRALSVQEYLTTLGLAKGRIRTLSFGEERPVEKGQSEEAFRLNRRAELVVVSPREAAAKK